MSEGKRDMISLFPCAKPIRPFDQHCPRPPLHRLKTFSAPYVKRSWTLDRWRDNGKAKCTASNRSPSVLICPTCGLFRLSMSAYTHHNATPILRRLNSTPRFALQSVLASNSGKRTMILLRSHCKFRISRNKRPSRRPRSAPRYQVSTMRRSCIFYFIARIDVPQFIPEFSWTKLPSHV